MFQLIGYYLRYQIYLALCYVTVNFLGLNLGIQSYLINLLDKLFQYINRNESKFFIKKRKPISVSIVDVDSVDETIKFDGYTKQEIDQFFIEKDTDQWNLLKPTWQPANSEYEYKLTTLGLVVYYFGLIGRLTVLFTHRLIIFTMLIICCYGGSSLVSLLMIKFPNSPTVKAINRTLINIALKLLGMGFSINCIHHVDENHGCDNAGGGIVIANHTGPTDIPILHSHVNYGFLFKMKKGFIFNPGYKGLKMDENFVPFEVNENPEVIKLRIVERVGKQHLNPLVIFAEGTCTPTDMLMRLSKGSFEFDCTIYPIAIKYNRLYCSPYWNSREINFLDYCLQNLIGWSTVADIYHLPPVNRKESESSVQFAERVQGLIANRIGLKQIKIDGVKAKSLQLN